MHVSVVESLGEISPRAWNSLTGTADPFLRYEFLAALEHGGCVGEETGWIPQFLIAEKNDTLLGAVPLYLKYHSFGEFVFDWAWAHAYQGSGRRYYPKLVVGVPYTPITGPRILTRQGGDGGQIAAQLITSTLVTARTLGVSSLHWLFANEHDARRLEGHGLMLRTGCQFHWHNHDYRNFDDFLGRLSAEKRKKIKRERRRPREDGIEFELLHGDAIAAQQWSTFYDFYRTTFWKKGNFPPLSLGFFEALGQRMPENVLLIMARHQGRYVAGAFFLRDRDTLYGRHWGCAGDYHSLHFETCYYRAIEYCIDQALQRFEAGAQGEHKLSRGFAPVATRSAHWIADEQFAIAIQDFIDRESHAVTTYIEEARKHLPYKSDGSHPPAGNAAQAHCRA